VRALRSLAFFKLGLWAGMAGGAMFMKRALPSRGDEDSDEVDLVAVFDGVDLKSRAKSFRGGSMLAWFGGIAVDFRDAELAPGARLSVRTLCGGIALKTPPGWRIESSVKALFGGVDIPTPAGDDTAARMLKLEGMAVFGGVAVSAKADAATADR
jgi:hypothetical protein